MKEINGLPLPRARVLVVATFDGVPSHLSSPSFVFQLLFGFPQSRVAILFYRKSESLERSSLAAFRPKFAFNRNYAIEVGTLRCTVPNSTQPLHEIDFFLSPFSQLARRCCLLLTNGDRFSAVMAAVFMFSEATARQFAENAEHTECHRSASLETTNEPIVAA